MYFYCYSIKCKDFLKLQGIPYYRRGRHSNGNMYWMFEKSEKLDEALKRWNEYKKIFADG